ncbi:MAG TPA: NlpC/P60 family protein [Candidatus Aminicenantes bacterium]|nr:NlpC/P60 family protein [Candidatus Aminicenantes bacterium]
MTKTVAAALLIALSPALACAAHVGAVGGAPPTQAPPQASAGPAAAVVTRAVENMFSRASADADVVSQAVLGTNVRLLRKERGAAGEDWYEVETPDTYKGWIAASALRVLGPGDRPYASSGRVFVVSALLANTYREPDVTAHRPVTVAPIGAVLEIVAEKGERWREVALPDRTRAWIQSGDGDIREAPWTWPRRPAEDMVALAKRFIGLPYTWGGTSPLGLDCSGFVQLVYRLNGVPILRDAGIQMTSSGLLEVPKGEERAGDLVFFGRSLDRISHVGMMIDGESFINATTSDAPVVQIDRLEDANWQRIYQGARRPADRSER